MTKGQLIERIAQLDNCTTTQAEIVVNTMFQAMKDALEENKRVEIRGFGTFEVRNYKKYIGRNPKTGEQVEVSSKRAPFFKAGKVLKQDLNKP